MARPKQCFISYSHHDRDGFERLRVHLGAVANLYGLSVEHDERLKAGDFWNEALQHKIVGSQIFVPLFTNDFYASTYIREMELPAMLERHANYRALLVPVVYRESCWRRVFGDYIQLLPKDQRQILKPICEWKDKEKAFGLAANAISDAIEDWFGIQPISHFPHRAGGAA